MCFASVNNIKVPENHSKMYEISCVYSKLITIFWGEGGGGCVFCVIITARNCNVVF